MSAAVRYRSSLALCFTGLVLVAWAALWWLEQTPWGALVHSHDHAHGGGHHHASIPPALAGLLFVTGWLLMTIAMMLPSTFPLTEIFRRLVGQRSDAALLLALLIAGYLAIWTLFGLFVYGARLAVGGIDLSMPEWGGAVVLFALAGAFQFSSLKHQCLDRCRTPLAFVLARWRGRRDRSAALRLGIAHGAFCVGCCWALMLLMFAVGTVSLLWMAVLGLLMAIEKNAPWGRRLGHPLGVVLLAVAAGLGAYHLGMLSHFPVIG